jgi:multidrug efflux pump subunit AcrB
MVSFAIVVVVILIIALFVAVLLGPAIYKIMTEGWSRSTCKLFLNALFVGIDSWSGGLINPGAVVCSGVGT